MKKDISFIIKYEKGEIDVDGTISLEEMKFMADNMSTKEGIEFGQDFMHTMKQYGSVFPKKAKKPIKKPDPTNELFKLTKAELVDMVQNIMGVVNTLREELQLAQAEIKILRQELAQTKQELAQTKQELAQTKEELQLAHIEIKRLKDKYEPDFL
ncbi:hypothetical protein ELUMI_v1c08630 [Williamsoniiplasma luminosum]|uniref:Uncharacterized protein n=2 Tax=Williamsoniiplasma luminosum TaxID=214888 RepID=A0A2K8NUY8_9MOLU|nr:hypothetical protein [Williamsoniiplasma luminosum]ATZ17584.1 hypothetical protein ELUMI_v1c08630 [Williamsoniiplasma luminosum]